MYWTTWFLSSFLFHKLIVSQLSICCCYRKTILSQWTKRRPSTLSTSQASPSVIFEKKMEINGVFFGKYIFELVRHLKIHIILCILKFASRYPNIFFKKKSKKFQKIFQKFTHSARMSISHPGRIFSALSDLITRIYF